VTQYHKAEDHSNILAMQRGQVCDVMSHALFTAVYIGRDLCSCDGVSRRGAASGAVESEERPMRSL
jgi:hypothetical protein